MEEPTNEAAHETTNDAPLDVRRLLTASNVRMRVKSPFFATLALFAKYIRDDSIPTAATDGVNILYNAEFIASLTPQQLDGLLLHEILHAALLHVPRRSPTRDRILWNIAADIVVNGMVMAHGSFALPEGGIRNEDLEHLSVEEVYAILERDGHKIKLTLVDLLDSTDVGAMRKNWAEIEAHWKHALRQAEAVARMAGKLPFGDHRDLLSVTEPQLDWRSQLWRYLVRTPTDFQGFDRRFVHQKLYLESFEGETVRVYVCVDTSGSITSDELTHFLGEVKGILGAYPHILCDFYYADADIYGPYDLRSTDDVPPPKGGGGTSFKPFFEAISQSEGESLGEGVCVYLTDGYGDFPDEAPKIPTLWVVNPGGLDRKDFPFGEVTQLLSP